jgi:hypothetical protein
MQHHRTQATFRMQSARSGNICGVGTGKLCRAGVRVVGNNALSDFATAPIRRRT